MALLLQTIVHWLHTNTLFTDNVLSLGSCEHRVSCLTQPHEYWVDEWNALHVGHSHPRWLQAVNEQAATLTHTSNLFHTEAGVSSLRCLPGSCLYLYAFLRYFAKFKHFQCKQGKLACHCSMLACIAAEYQQLPRLLAQNTAQL